jgi:hypothetical protein
MSHDEFLDRAIDQVARELTDGAPRQGFAGRVRQRLEPPQTAFSWRWPLAAGVAAAAVALVIWLMLPTRTVTPIAPATTQVADRALPVPSTEAPQIARGPAHESTTQHETSRHAPRIPLPRLQIPVDIEDAPQIAAMPALSDLAVKPIEIAELTIAPLEPEKESR